jgi:hypothetical protein
VYANQQLSEADLGYGDAFQADIVHAAIDGGLHGRGNRQGMTFDRKLSGILSSHGHRAILDDFETGVASKQEDGVPMGNGVGRVCGSAHSGNRGDKTPLG